MAKKEASQPTVISVGTFVEFQEKKRVHIGKILDVEHKANGGARYMIQDSEGNKYTGLSDKDVLYSMPCPNTPGKANVLYEEFSRAQDIPVNSLKEKLDISTEVLHMAWEETLENESEEKNDRIITAAEVFEIIQGHAASAMDKYLVWKMLKTDLGHLFFKEIKDHGRVVAFKAKTKKAVNAAIQAFCNSRDHVDDELCIVA